MYKNNKTSSINPEKIVRDIIACEKPKNWQPSKMTKDSYLDIMEQIVRMAAQWQDKNGAIIDPVLNKEWCQTTPRFISSGAVLLANGRIADLKEKILLSMDYSCKEFTAEDIRQRSSDFWMRELVTAYQALVKMVSPQRAAKWKENLSLVVPQLHYRYFYPDESLQKKCANWVVHSACGELLREYSGIGGVNETLWGKDFFETYMRWQPEHFNEYGMYLEPGHPITYDLTTRLQFAAAFECSYNEALREKLLKILDKGDFITLLEVAPGGEVPFGGRSSQFYYQEAIVAALCEAAANKYKTADPKLAGVFKRQAHLSATVTRQGFVRNDGQKFHIKNKFPINTRHGCDDYGQFSVYSLLTASILAVAVNFADDSIIEYPAPSEIGGFSFSITGSFEKAFMNANKGFLQFDLLADQKYDATGLGRIILQDMPWGLLPVLPFAAEPNYIRMAELPSVDYPVAIAPEWIDKEGTIHRLAEKSTVLPGVMNMLNSNSCEVKYHYDDVTVTYKATLPEVNVLNLDVTLEGNFNKAHFVLPILETDGQLTAVSKISSGQLEVIFDGGKLFVNSNSNPYKLNDKVVNRTGAYALWHLPFENNKLSMEFRVVRN